MGAIEGLHRQQTLKTWFGRLRNCYQTRVAARNKQQLLTDYYELKSTEMLYRKYFWRLRLFGLHSRAEKFHYSQLSRKTVQGLQLNFIRWTNILNKLDDLLAEKQAKCMHKVLSVLGRALNKRRKAEAFRRSYLQKSYLGMWLQSIVTVHLRNTSKATHYRNTSLKYKAMFALTSQVELSKKMLDVVRMRLRHLLQRWCTHHRATVYRQELELELKAKIFRELKLMVYTRR